MPLRQYNPVHSKDYGRLVSRLSDEWSTPDDTASEPVIIEESNSRQDVTRVFVVWSDWADLDRVKRGEIIMDAAEKVKPVPDVLKITIAMGLTPDEADRFGLQWR